MANAHKEARFTEDFDSELARTENEPGLHHSKSTLKKKEPLMKKLSVHRSNNKPPQERKSIHLDEDYSNPASPFHTPVPTHGNPTEALASRFNEWRHILKDFISYFKELSSAYEIQMRTCSRLSGAVVSSFQYEGFMEIGGIFDTNTALANYHKRSLNFAESAHEAVSVVIKQLQVVRADLSTKVREIKALSGDFKNNIDKEKDLTKRAILQYLDSVSRHEGQNPQSGATKTDPYIARLAVQRQLKKHLEEENYLQRAYLNLESSGRRLDSIVVSEVQNAFKIYASLLQREGELSLEFSQTINTTTLQLPPDREWCSFIQKDSKFISPATPLRSIQDIRYPEHLNPIATEVRSGPLERKSKYLKSYSTGWFVLTPTHLHEFKTSNRLEDIVPVMSLSLAESNLGSHSNADSKSHKFVLKGRQNGALHRGHTWIFRAASHDTMLSWYHDFQNLVGLSDTERDAFMSTHHNVQSQEPTQEISPNADAVLENDEADEVPYSKEAEPDLSPQLQDEQTRRPEGGRFPSEIRFEEHQMAAVAHSSENDESESWQNEISSISSKNRPPSVWSYDEKHPTQSTLETGEQFVPVEADVPPEIERELNQRHTSSSIGSVDGDDRRDSGAFVRKVPSRQPTASYGIDPVTGETDPNATGVNLEQMDWSQLSNDQSDHVVRSASFTRKPPSRKPTASYGFELAGTEPSYPDVSEQALQVNPDDVQLFFAEEQHVVGGGEDHARPALQESYPSQSTLQNMKVPGTYPKE